MNIGGNFLRIVTGLLILIICFVIGVFFGLMYDSPEHYHHSNNIVELEREIEEKVNEAKIVTKQENDTIESVPLENVQSHPIEKVANVSEKVINSFFEKVVKMLASISDALL
jgi:cell division protein FtsL